MTVVPLATACLWAQPVSALGLGRLAVQSALGESLKAEIEVTSITAEEAASLHLRIAPPETYRAAGVDYNAVLPSAAVEIVKRADGRSVLRLSSDRAVLEPFVDVIVEANWSSGRLVREYTLLFDPPNSRVAAAPEPTVAAVASPVPAPAPTPTAELPASAPVVAAASAPVPMKRPATPTRLTAQGVAAPAAASAASTTEPGPDSYQVKPGDTLSRVAVRTQHTGISLDQMLVSLFRGNPQAFMAENINRLKAGALLAVPSAEQAAQVSPAEARKLIIAQSADFGAYREKLAAGAGRAPDTAPARQAKGQVQAKVDDRKAATATTPDRLTLAQGSAKLSAGEPPPPTPEKKDQQARLAELNRNVEALKQLQGAAAPASVAAAASAPARISAPAPAPAPVSVAASASPVPALPAVLAAASVASAPSLARPDSVAVAAASAASSPTSSGVVRPLPAPPLRAEEPSLLDSLLDNALLLPGVGVLVALLGGLGLYRLRGRLRKPPGETSFLESRLQPDSFFGVSGGQRVDTRDAMSSGNSGNSSSLNYSMSQLDAIGDVDPVAEADVYLAYGRDLQAEEILKEAMRSAPDRMAIRTKLLEVYAKRRDTKAFELLATQLFSLTGGVGEDWAKAQSLGVGIEPDNALYRPGGAPAGARAGSPSASDALGANTQFHADLPTLPSFEPTRASTSADELDLELDFAPNPAVAASPASRSLEATQPLQAAGQSRPDARSNAPPEQPRAATTARAAATPAAPARAPTAKPADGNNMLDFDLGGSADAPRGAAKKPSAKPDSALDFSGFELGNSAAEPTTESSAMARKLELAEEFRQIGDLEGARDLLDEVLAKSDGSLKSKAQGMLEQLARR